MLAANNTNVAGKGQSDNYIRFYFSVYKITLFSAIGLSLLRIKLQNFVWSRLFCIGEWGFDLVVLDHYSFDLWRLASLLPANQLCSLVWFYRRQQQILKLKNEKFHWIFLDFLVKHDKINKRKDGSYWYKTVNQCECDNLLEFSKENLTFFPAYFSEN